MAEFSIEKMKEILKSKGYTYGKLAELTGISESTISKLFGGFNPNPTLKYMKSIANALDCSIDDFIDWGGIEPTSPYYLDRKTAELAQNLKDNPDLRAVLRSMRNLSPDDIKFVQEFIEKIKK